MDIFNFQLIFGIIHISFTEIPRAYNSYKRVDDKLEQPVLDQLIAYHRDIALDYYRSRPAALHADLPYLSDLNAFLVIRDHQVNEVNEVNEANQNHQITTSLTVPCSVNERSFQIFRDEKFLSSAAGRALLQRVGLNLAKLACFQTCEPFFYVQYLQPGDDFAHLLIVENKDTFFSLKKCLTATRRTLAGIPYNFLIYGEGRKIVTSFAFYREVQGLGGQTPLPIKVYYFGDLDPEGIDIFGQLQENFPELSIEPFTYLYSELLKLYPERPKQRDKNQKLKPERLDRFLSYFLPEVAAEIQNLLAAKRYLPQEGLNYAYFAGEVK